MDGPNTRSWRRARLAAPPLAAEHLLESPTAPERPAPKPASFAWLVSSSALSISLSTFGCGRLDIPSGPAEVARFPIAVLKQPCRPLMVFDATINSGYGREPHFKTSDLVGLSVRRTFSKRVSRDGALHQA